MKDYIYVLLIILSSLCYAINQLWYQGKLRWDTEPYGTKFWGKASWTRKYAAGYIRPPKNWYYKFFKIVSKERFPLSATFLVGFTDGMHMTQHFYFIFLVLAMVTTPHTWMALGIASGTLLFSFWFWYKVLSR